MFENVAAHLDEAVRLAERCPEKYQIPCFQALVRVLAQFDSPTANSESGNALPVTGNGEFLSPLSNGPYANSSPLRQPQANDRGLVFLDQHQISGEDISRVYHLDGGSYRIIVKDLKEKTNSKKQIKLALLLGIAGLLAGRQPVFSKEKLIEVCREYGAYDGPNFASHMRRQRDMFIAQGNDWSLTVPAQQRAAEAIKELMA
ncbi:MAG: hypothetical protein BZY87_06600 [SAR202 cluster bacterium Io17-Chloro-G6]|nr:MAG: hypothetical protein BZY87_06600 [SAR202 cluster bacterium Io17-Chloro-G6]